jgi:hypothetical protein
MRYASLPAPRAKPARRGRRVGRIEHFLVLRGAAALDRKLCGATQMRLQKALRHSKLFLFLLVIRGVALTANMFPTDARPNVQVSGVD